MSLDFSFRYAYLDNVKYRYRLNELTKEVFGLDFSPWLKLNLHLHQYTPFSYFHDGRIAANVSASPMHLIIDQKPIEAIQVGTVAALPEYRKRGLVRSLLEKAHSHWSKTHSLFFLFANEKSAEFYHQFGYRQMKEYVFSQDAPTFESASMPARKLSILSEQDVQLLADLGDKRAPVSRRLGVYRHGWLLTFHGAVIYPTDMIYIEDFDTIVISRIQGKTLILVDIISENMPSLNQIYPYVGNNNINKIEYLFSPDLLDTGTENAQESDEILLVRGDFPIPEKPFRFPITSQA